MAGDAVPGVPGEVPGHVDHRDQRRHRECPDAAALVAANNSASPDMAWMESGEMGAYADAGLLADVDTWLTSKAERSSRTSTRRSSRCARSTGKVS